MSVTLQQVQAATAYSFLFSDNTEGVVLLLQDNSVVAAWSDGNVYNVADLEKACQEQHVPANTDQLEQAIKDFITYAKL